MLTNFTGQSKLHLGQRRRTTAKVRAPSGAGKFLSILKEQMASGGTEDRWIGRTLTGAYRLAERLGKGGMGAVYRAEHIRTSGLRAIKILLPEAAADPDIYRRFEDEAKITSALRHPNIVQVMDFDTDADTPFIVMEYLDGVTLDAQLRKNGPMSLAEGIELLRQVGSALHAAHSAGVVHRDIKPANILLCRYLLAGKQTMLAKVLDFGISHIRRSVSMMTQDRTILGTPQYMAPEMARARNSELDGRADQFSLAVVLYYAFSGTKPFDSDDAIAVLHQVIYEQPESLAKLAPQLPPHVVAAIERAMSKRKEDRFPDVLDFVHAVEHQPASVPLNGASTYKLVLPETAPPPSVSLAVSKGDIEEELFAADSALANARTISRLRERWPMWLGGLFLLIGGMAAGLYRVARNQPIIGHATTDSALPEPAHAATSPLQSPVARTDTAKSLASSDSSAKERVVTITPDPVAATEVSSAKSATTSRRGITSRHAVSVSSSAGEVKYAAAEVPAPPASQDKGVAAAPTVTAVSATLSPSNTSSGSQSVPLAIVAPVGMVSPAPAPIPSAPPTAPAPAFPSVLTSSVSTALPAVSADEVRAACDARDGQKARALYARLQGSQRGFVQFYCDKLGVYLTGSATSPATESDDDERELAKAVSQAKLLLQTNPAQASKLLAQAMEDYGDSGAAWLIFGMAACKQRNKYDSFTAYKKLDVSKRQQLLGYCQSVGFSLLPQY